MYTSFIIHQTFPGCIHLPGSLCIRHLGELSPAISFWHGYAEQNLFPHPDFATMEELAAVSAAQKHGKRERTMNDQNNEYTEWDHEAAKRIACAVMSYQAGVTYESLWAPFADQKDEPGTFWLSLAKQIREHLPQKSK